MNIEERFVYEDTFLPGFKKEPIYYNWDQPLKDCRPMYRKYLPLVRVLLKTRYSQVTYIGTENIPQTGGYIIAANHQSTGDPLNIINAMNGFRPMYIMANEIFFHTPVFRNFFYKANVFPVDRFRADLEPLKFAVRVIKEGYPFVLFPQGMRDMTRNRPKNFLPGAAMIARDAQADILPVSIHLSHTYGKRPICVIRFGELIPFEDLGFTPNTRKARELKAATQLIQEKVAKLWDMDIL